MTQEQRQALPQMIAQLVHMRWLIAAIPLALRLARTAFAAICSDPAPGMQTSVFFLGMLDEAISAFKQNFSTHPVMEHVVEHLRDNMQESQFPYHGLDPIIVVQSPGVAVGSP